MDDFARLRLMPEVAEVCSYTVQTLRMQLFLKLRCEVRENEVIQLGAIGIDFARIDASDGLLDCFVKGYRMLCVIGVGRDEEEISVPSMDTDDVALGASGV